VVPGLFMLGVMDREGLKEMDYWFPAKPSGLGWGPPTKWQGWAFLVGWITLLLSGFRVLGSSNTSSLLFLAGMIAVLLLVIFFKGEPRRVS
jgi:hypothetical protein